MTLDDLRQQYREQILVLAEQYKAENVRVFGSVARGEAAPGSDIDILVHFKQGASLLDESGLEIAIGDLLHQSVDVVGDDSLHPAFQHRINAEAVTL